MSPTNVEESEDILFCNELLHLFKRDGTDQDLSQFKSDSGHQGASISGPQGTPLSGHQGLLSEPDLALQDSRSYLLITWVNGESTYDLLGIMTAPIN